MTKHRTGIKNSRDQAKVGTCFVHTVIDDYSPSPTPSATTMRPPRPLSPCCIDPWPGSPKRVLSDNGSAYKSFLWRNTCEALGIEAKKTRPYRAQTSGKIERLHRTLSDGWAYKKLYHSENARRAALAGWLHQYNHHRPHTAIGGLPPISRLNNLAGHHS